MKKLVVVGNGMAGMACLEQILKYSPRFDVTVFSDETHVNYNRVLLSSVLAGEKDADDIVINGLEWYQTARHRPPRRRADRRCRFASEDGHRQRRTRHAVRHVAAGDGQLPVVPADCRARQGRRVRVPHARRHAGAARARGTADARGRHRRRPARSRGGARAAGAGVPRHRRAPDGHADGTAARSLRRRVPAVEDRGAGRERAARPQHQGDPRRRHGHRRRVLGRLDARGRPRRGGGRHPTERRVGPEGRPHRQSRHRRQRLDGDVRPGHLCRRRVHGAQRDLLRPGGAALRAGQGAGGDHHREQGADLYRDGAGRQAQDHGGRRLLGRRMGGRDRRRAGALRGSGAWRLQEARVARRQAGGRDSRRRRRRQPSLHGLAALRCRSDGAAAPPPVSAAVGRRRTRCRGDGRERHRVRLRRRDQGHDHPRHSRAAA